MKRTLQALLGIMFVQSMGCATGDFALIEERYQARLARCADPESQDRKNPYFSTYELCAKDAKKVRDEGKLNQYSLRRFFPESGPASPPIMIYHLN